MYRSERLYIPFAHELADPGFPLAALVLGDSPEPGAPPDEAGALSPEHLDELLLAEAVHLRIMHGKQCCLNQIVKKNTNIMKMNTAAICSLLFVMSEVVIRPVITFSMSSL
jgi:hypothetical protein